MMHGVRNLIKYSLPHGWYINPKSTIRNLKSNMSWKKIYETQSPIKAQLAKAFLFDEHQIEAIVLNKQDSSYLIGLCEVHVPIQDAVLAKFLLENEGGLD